MQEKKGCVCLQEGRGMKKKEREGKGKCIGIEVTRGGTRGERHGDRGGEGGGGDRRIERG